MIHGVLLVPASTMRRRRSEPVNCSVSDCAREAWARGWCPRHYQQWYKTGDPLPFERKRKERETDRPPTFVKFTPELWAEWWDSRFVADRQTLQLRNGIEQFRQLLAARP